MIECEDEWSNERKSNLDNLVSLPLVSAFHRRPLTLILPLRLKLRCLRVFLPIHAMERRDTCNVANEKCTSRNSSSSSLRLKRTMYYYFPELWNKLRDIIFQTIPNKMVKGDDRKSEEFRSLLECLEKLGELSKRWKFLSGEISYVTWNLRDDREKFQFENFNVTKSRAEIFSLEFGKISNFIP